MVVASNFENMNDFEDVRFESLTSEYRNSLPNHSCDENQPLVQPHELQDPEVAFYSAYFNTRRKNSRKLFQLCSEEDGKSTSSLLGSLTSLTSIFSSKTKSTDNLVEESPDSVERRALCPNLPVDYPSRKLLSRKKSRSFNSPLRPDIFFHANGRTKKTSIHFPIADLHKEISYENNGTFDYHRRKSVDLDKITSSVYFDEKQTSEEGTKDSSQGNLTMTIFEDIKTKPTGLKRSLTFNERLLAKNRSLSVKDFIWKQFKCKIKTYYTDHSVMIYDDLGIHQVCLP